jgi:hypothetical protein
MMKDEIRKEFRPVFGAAYDEIIQAEDWSELSDEDRGIRLRDALRREDLKYGRPFRLESGFDFAYVVRQLAQTD